MDRGSEQNRVTLSVTLPPQLKGRLRKIAEAENNTVSRIVENALVPFVEEHPLFDGEGAPAST